MRKSMPCGSKKKTLRADDSGATLIAFAGMFGAMALAVGAAIDYARLSGVQSALQRDLDAAVLAAATKGGDNLTSDQIVDTYFGSNWRETHQSGEVAVTVSDADSSITAEATAPVPMSFMKLIGIAEGNAKAVSKVNVGGKDMEMALVLDTTYSMSGQKLEDLKTAAKKLLDTVYSRSGSENHVKVGIVPFSAHVNVGEESRNRPWISVDPDTEEQQCSMVKPVIGSENCRTETYTYTSDGVEYTNSQQVCDAVYGPEEEQCNTVTTKWYGCVGSRLSPLNVRDEQYSTRIPGLMNRYCAPQLTPLTNDKAVLGQKIDELFASYDTYIPSGLMWGWRVLSKIEPFNEARPDALVANGKLRKVLVLMSDGQNTRSQTPGEADHDDTDAAAADAMTVEVCEKIKSAGIQIYTVAFDVTDTNVIDQMKNCATDISKFFQTGTGDELKSAFEQIGRSTQAVSLAQ